MSTGIRLSKSQLDKFEACPRCFWLAQRHKLKQPDMISSKVWKGVERVTIAHYERHRVAKTLPPELSGFVPPNAIPYQGDRISLKELRYWGKGLPFLVDGVTVTTALDDMLQRDRDTCEGVQRLYSVIDYKSKSKATDEEATAGLYANQADVFDLACNVNGYPTDGRVYFAYHYPVAIDDAEPGSGDVPHGILRERWACQVVELKADHERVKALVRRAAACLESAMPDPPLNEKGGIGCEVCLYVEARGALFSALGVPA